MLVAWIDVPTAGDYSVSTDTEVTWASNPQLRFGPPSNAGSIGFTVLFTTAGLILLGIIAAIVKSRTQPKPGPQDTAVTDTIPASEI